MQLMACRHELAHKDGGLINDDLEVPRKRILNTLKRAPDTLKRGLYDLKRALLTLKRAL